MTIINYLIQNSPKPIVFTGSQKPIDNPLTDAIANIYDAFTVACSDNCFGINLVFFGSIIAGSRARKNYSKSYFAFGSINFPELGHVYDNKVTKYINDPKCGKGSSNGFYKELLKGNRRLYKKKFLAKINKDLQILVAAGDQDPVGKCGKGPKRLEKMYTKLGVKDVTLSIYPNMRHEIHNENGREEVLKDFLTFIEK